MSLDQAAEQIITEEQNYEEDINEERLIKSQAPDLNTQFRCQQCRAPLFKGSDVIPHENTKLRKFSHKRKEFGGDECQSYFIQQPGWLDATGRMSDTIYCPKCNYKLGRFSWKGSQCSCGEWVNPSFQIPMSRVDSV